MAFSGSNVQNCVLLFLCSLETNIVSAYINVWISIKSFIKTVLAFLKTLNYTLYDILCTKKVTPYFWQPFFCFEIFQVQKSPLRLCSTIPSTFSNCVKMSYARIEYILLFWVGESLYVEKEATNGPGGHVWTSLSLKVRSVWGILFGQSGLNFWNFQFVIK